MQHVIAGPSVHRRLDGDAVKGTLTVSPHIPQNWIVRFDNYRVGRSTVSGTIARSRGEVRITLDTAGAPLRMTLSPAFAAGAKLLRDATLRTAALLRVEAVIQMEAAVEPLPILINPAPGDSRPGR